MSDVIECILSQNDLEHIALCDSKFAPMIESRGIRWSANDIVLQNRYSHLTLLCRGDCNIQKTIDMLVAEDVPDMRTLDLGLKSFYVDMMIGECPICKVVHAARSLPKKRSLLKC